MQAAPPLIYKQNPSLAGWAIICSTSASAATCTAPMHLPAALPPWARLLCVQGRSQPAVRIDAQVGLGWEHCGRAGGPGRGGTASARAGLHRRAAGRGVAPRRQAEGQVQGLGCRGAGARTLFDWVLVGGGGEPEAQEVAPVLKALPQGGVVGGRGSTCRGGGHFGAAGGPKPLRVGRRRRPPPEGQSPSPPPPPNTGTQTQHTSWSSYDVRVCSWVQL